MYSFDRLVATCVGRPFGISDQAISTEFPSMVDDEYITKSGLTSPPEGAPTYKHVAFHYFKLRLLQSEIHDVLQYQQARAVRRRTSNSMSILPHAELTSPFLQGFDSFRSWRHDVHRRLMEWHETAPTRRRHICSPGNGTLLDDQCFSASIFEKWHVAINLVVYLPYLFCIPVY